MTRSTLATWIVALALLAACAPAAPAAPTAAPAKPTTAPAPAAKPTEAAKPAAASPAAKPAAAASPAAKPAASPSAKPAASPAASPAAAAPAAKPPAAPAFNQAAWNETLAAARSEGKIVILGPQGTDVRDALVLPFQAKFPEIEVDFTNPPTSQIPPKLTTEQAAGQFLTDLVIVGSTTVLGTLGPANAVAPIRPYLTGPDATNPAPWLGNAINSRTTRKS
jgi:hypothetical protein